MRPRPAPRVPDPTVVVARAAFPKGSPAMSARDELADVFADEQFAAAFGMRGAPAESPGALALVTVLQYVENLTDRQAGLMVARAIDWKYALGLELTDPGFDPSVLSVADQVIPQGCDHVIPQVWPVGVMLSGARGPLVRDAPGSGAGSVAGSGHE